MMQKMTKRNRASGFNSSGLLAREVRGQFVAGVGREVAVQHKHLRFGHGFRVVLGDESGQAAQMTLLPGESEGGPDNRHRGADQWLYVVSGSGVAVLNGERVELREGTCVLIQCGDKHEIRNTSETPLKTLNVYMPPTYTPEGEDLPRGKRSRVQRSLRGAPPVLRNGRL
jgi:mannose-6-phosphate isomerase-like protein (cupin superfamily)